MNFFNLDILFTDGTKKSLTVKRVSNLSSTKSKFFYYEEPNDMEGKGTCIPKADIECFECNLITRRKM